MNKPIRFSLMLAFCLLFASCAKQSSRNLQTDELFRAVREGNTDMVRSLLSAPGVNVNPDGKTALMLAMQNNHDDVVRVLKQAGAAE